MDPGDRGDAGEARQVTTISLITNEIRPGQETPLYAQELTQGHSETPQRTDLLECCDDDEGELSICVSFTRRSSSRTGIKEHLPSYDPVGDFFWDGRQWMNGWLIEV